MPSFKGSQHTSIFSAFFPFLHLCLALTFQKSCIQRLLFLLSSNLLLKLLLSDFMSCSFSRFLFGSLTIPLFTVYADKISLNCCIVSDVSGICYELQELSSYPFFIFPSWSYMLDGHLLHFSDSVS